MTNLLSNFLTRPDFISFHWAHRMLPAVWLCSASPAARVLLDGAEPADHGAGGAGGMSGDL